MQPHEHDQPAPGRYRIFPADVEVLESSVDAGVGPKEPKLRRGASTHGPVEPPVGEVDLPACVEYNLCMNKALRRSQRYTIPCDICSPL
jgi:hypothetical protein